MCTDGVSHLVMSDPRVMQLLSRPNIDPVHWQVVMMLYSLDAEGRLDEYAKVLPVYLGVSSERCSEILAAIEAVGLMSRSSDSLILTYPIKPDPSADACGCAMI